MNSRHKSREVALQFLYQHDPVTGAPTAEPHQLVASIRSHFDHFQVPEESREFAARLIAGTLGELQNLDQVIEQRAANWKLNRMAAVDRCLLRMGVYELTHFKETAPSIVINEAVELAKQFGTSETPAFINGILDAVVKANP